MAGLWPYVFCLALDGHSGHRRGGRGPDAATLVGGEAP
jgi:hypothetical protein